MATQKFQAQLTAFLPKMRAWALALTRNNAAAEDLVQEVAMRVLMASSTFIPGTNFSACVHRIMMNKFLSDVRQKREFCCLDDVPEVAMPPTQQEATDLRQLNIAFQRLPQDQKEALRSVAIDERSYEEVADETGCPIGTLKSRIHRARLQLRSEFWGGTGVAA